MSERPWGPRDPNHRYWTAPRGVWLAHPDLPALACPYPCACQPGRRCNPKRCNCAGRLDLADVPATCCAHYNTPEVVMKAKRQ